MVELKVELSGMPVGGGLIGEAREFGQCHMCYHFLSGVIGPSRYICLNFR